MLMWAQRFFAKTCANPYLRVVYTKKYGYLRLCWQPAVNVHLVISNKYKGIGDAGSTVDLRMLWIAIVCIGLL